jgi:hypothetical protein
MKKIIISILIILFVNNAFAQFAFGIAGNYTTSLGFDKNWDFAPERLKFDSKAAHGFAAGFFLRTGKRFFVQPEIMYNFMISKVTIENSDTHTRDIRLNTINLPILLGGKIVSTNFFNLRIMFGPRFRFDAGSKNSTASPDDIEVSPRKWQLGLETGLGFDLGRVTIDARYNLMQDIFSYTYSANKEELKLNPLNSFSIGIGVKIVDIKRK